MQAVRNSPTARPATRKVTNSRPRRRGRRSKGRAARAVWHPDRALHRKATHPSAAEPFGAEALRARNGRRLQEGRRTHKSQQPESGGAQHGDRWSPQQRQAEPDDVAAEKKVDRSEPAHGAAKRSRGP